MIKLCIEATNINYNFVNQTSKGAEKVYGNEKYDVDDLPEKKLYKYKRFILENKFHVVCRTEIDSYIKKTDADDVTTIQFLKINALNEYDLNNDWRVRLDTNRGALSSTEYRNNSCKISKWICEAQLADVDTVKLGFISRVAPKDLTKHAVLIVETVKTSTLSQTIGYRVRENWSIIKHLMETLQKQEDGIFALVKLPYKQAIRIYRIPKEEETQ